MDLGCGASDGSLGREINRYFTDSNGRIGRMDELYSSLDPRQSPRGEDQEAGRLRSNSESESSADALGRNACDEDCLYSAWLARSERDGCHLWPTRKRNTKLGIKGGRACDQRVLDEASQSSACIRAAARGISHPPFAVTGRVYRTMRDHSSDAR